MCAMISDELIDLIADEMIRQNLKFGDDRNQPPSDWMCILSEEVGEVSKEICEAGFRSDAMDLDKYKDELVQVIAVAVQMIKNIPKYSPDYKAPNKKPAVLQELRVAVPRRELMQRSIGTARDKYLRDKISEEVNKWCENNNAQLVKFDLENNFYNNIEDKYFFDLIVSYTEKDDA